MLMWVFVVLGPVSPPLMESRRACIFSSPTLVSLYWLVMQRCVAPIHESASLPSCHPPLRLVEAERESIARLATRSKRCEWPRHGPFVDESEIDTPDRNTEQQTADANAKMSSMLPPIITPRHRLVYPDHDGR